MAKKMLLLGVFILLGCGLAANVSLGDPTEKKDQDQWENTVAVAVRTLKDVYEVGEAAPLFVAIANHSAKPVYSFYTESDFRDGFCTVRDANGARVSGDPIPTPLPPPPYYYMQQDGKMVLTVPLYEIPAHGVRILLIADALRLHHGHISEGTYFLSLGDVEILHDVKSVIIRDGLPYRLWVEPSSPVTRQRHKVNDVKIEIRKTLPVPLKPEDPLREETSTAVTARNLWTWPSFLVGIIGGIVLFAAALVLGKNLGRSGKAI